MFDGTDGLSACFDGTYTAAVLSNQVIQLPMGTTVGNPAHPRAPASGISALERTCVRPVWHSTASGGLLVGSGSPSESKSR